MIPAQSDQALNEVKKLFVYFFLIPIEPADLIVLTVRVVVPLLRMADLVAREQHRNSLGEQQCGHEIALLLASKAPDCGIVSGAFHTAVPAAVIVRAVAVFFTVGLVMFGVVADQVLQREAIMGSDKIDAGIRLAPAARVKIAGSGKAVGEFADQAAITLPVRANGIAIFIIPFGPAGREFADLITAFAKVPRFGDQFHLRRHGILMDNVEKSSETIHFVQFAGECRCEIT